jgi:hypothetical protein
MHEETINRMGRSAKEMAMVRAVRPLVVVRGPQVFDCKIPMKRSIVSITRAKRRQSCTFSRIWNFAVRF